MNRFKLYTLIGLLVVAGLALFGQAYAQSIVAPNTGVGLPEKVASGTISIAAGTPAVIVSAVSGKSIKPISMKLATVTTGGIVTFYDGADATKPLGLNAYCPASTTANNNVDVPEQILGPGNGTTSGSALCAQLNGCTLVYVVRYRLQ